MSKSLNTAAAIIALSVGSIPAHTANCHDHPWGCPQAQVQPRTGYAGPMSLQHDYAAPPSR